MAARTVPVLDIGGTHVTAARVGFRDAGMRVLESYRNHIYADAPADELIATIASAARRLNLNEPHRWAVAIPGPFDYAAGIGRFEHVGKFETLNGIDVRGALRSSLEDVMHDVDFLNDADAYGLGECAAGAGKDHARAICLTLGTGVGSAFIANRAPVNTGPTVPPDGSAHLLTWRCVPLEDVVSRRAIRRAYEERTGRFRDVREIAEHARDGDIAARSVLDDAMSALGETIAPWIDRFEASALIIGGSMSASWDLLEPALRVGIARSGADATGITLAAALHTEEAPLLGAASTLLTSSDHRMSDLRREPLASAD